MSGWIAIPDTRDGDVFDWSSNLFDLSISPVWSVGDQDDGGPDDRSDDLHRDPPAGGAEWPESPACERDAVRDADYGQEDAFVDLDSDWADQAPQLDLLPMAEPQAPHPAAHGVVLQSSGPSEPGEAPNSPRPATFHAGPTIKMERATMEPLHSDSVAPSPQRVVAEGHCSSRNNQRRRSSNSHGVASPPKKISKRAAPSHLTKQLTMAAVTKPSRVSCRARSMSQKYSGDAYDLDVSLLPRADDRSPP